jgi:hypothetical protein
MAQFISLMRVQEAADDEEAYWDTHPYARMGKNLSNMWNRGKRADKIQEVTKLKEAHRDDVLAMADEVLAAGSEDGEDKEDEEGGGEDDSGSGSDEESGSGSGDESRSEEDSSSDISGSEADGKEKEEGEKEEAAADQKTTKRAWKSRVDGSPGSKRRDKNKGKGVGVVMSKAADRERDQTAEKAALERDERGQNWGMGMR